MNYLTLPPKFSRTTPPTTKTLEEIKQEITSFSAANQRKIKGGYVMHIRRPRSIIRHIVPQ